MALRLKYGVGDVPANLCDTRWAWAIPKCWSWLNPTTRIAVPVAPEGSALTLPPASGEDAEATVDALVDQQMRDEQALMASRVTSSWLDDVASGAVAASEVRIGGLSPLAWLGVGLGVIALVFVGGGSPRRYGR
jgi:uncharacterized protein YfaQ (DUF2300 family)